MAELSGLKAINETAIYESNPTVHAWFKRVEDRMKVPFKESMQSIDALNKQFNASQE